MAQVVDGILVFNLLDEVMAFLQACPCDHDHPYAGDRIWKRERDLLECIAWDQYILTRDADGNLTGFMSYWKIRPEDRDTIITGNDRDIEKIRGTHGWVVDVGCNGTNFRQLCRLLAIKGSPFNGVSSYHYKSKQYRTFLTGTLCGGE